MDSLEIRLLLPDDGDEVVNLFAAQLRDHGIATGWADLQAVIRAVAEDRRQGFILLACLSSEPVGVAYASAILSFEHAGVSGWLEELYVVPAQRGLGVGTKLLVEVLAEARRRGWRAIDLEVESGHERASRLYARHGFRPHTRQRWFLHLGNGGDAEPNAAADRPRD